MWPLRKDGQNSEFSHKKGRLGYLKLHSNYRPGLWSLKKRDDMVFWESKSYGQFTIASASKNETIKLWIALEDGRDTGPGIIC